MEKIEWIEVCPTKITTFEMEYISKNCKFVITSHYNDDKKLYNFKGFYNRNINNIIVRYEIEPAKPLDTLDRCKEIAENLIRAEEFYNEFK
jgi:hypothetical protein